MVEKHPLFDMPLNVKQAYLQGCTMATLLETDGFTEDKKQVVHSIGVSLGLGQSEIKECIDLFRGMREEDKADFIEGMLATLESGHCGAMFLYDFETTATKFASLSSGSRKFLQNVSGRLLGVVKGWRKSVFDQLGQDELKVRWLNHCFRLDEEGDADAAFLLAYSLENGLFCEQSDAKAKHFYARAVEGGVEDGREGLA